MYNPRLAVRSQLFIGDFGDIESPQPPAIHPHPLLGWGIPRKC